VRSPLALHSPREYVRHVPSAESLSVSLAPPDDPVALSRRPDPTESVYLPLDRHFFRLPSTPARVLFLVTAVSLSRAFDHVYISLTRLPLFFPLSLLLPFAPRPSRSRLRTAKFGRTHAATCLRHLVQCVGGEREEISRRGSFLH